MPYCGHIIFIIVIILSNNLGNIVIRHGRWKNSLSLINMNIDNLIKVKFPAISILSCVFKGNYLDFENKVPLVV
jgi:hypothetical protein